MASHFSFEAIGTMWQIDIYEALSLHEESVLLRLVRDRIDLFDLTYSRFRPDSLVTAMSQEAGSYTLPDDAHTLLSLYHEIYLTTNGAVTPLIGQTLTDAGYDASYSLRQQRPLHTPPSWDAALEYHHPTLIVKQPVLLDFGAAGKGYLIDIVAQLLQEWGCTSFCIDAGGDIIHRNTTSLRVGLENPTDSTQVIGILDLMNKSLCGSAGNRRAWETFHHIIDPKKLSSPKDIIAVWVLADTTLVADALTTCLFFVSPKELEKYDFEYLILWKDFSIEKSDGFECVL